MGRIFGVHGATIVLWPEIIKNRSKFRLARAADLPELNIKEQNIVATELNHALGRPRMPTYAVYVFVMIRRFLGSLTPKPARRFLRESMSLYRFFRGGAQMPPVPTILENVNLVSHTTRELNLDKQIAFNYRL